MGSSRKIVNGVFWTTVLNIVNAVYGFIAVPILIRYFGKSEYGLIGLAMSVNLYMRLMDMGFNSTNVRFFSTWLAEEKYNKVKKAFQTSLAFYGSIGLLNGIILLGIAYMSGVLFNVTAEQNTILQHLLYILAVSAFCNWFSSCFDQLIKATENVGWIQRRQLIPKLLQVVVLFATVYIGFSIEIYYALTCLATLSILPLSISKIRREVSFVNFVPKLDIRVFKEMLPYSLNIFSFSLFQFSFYHLRPVFLGMQGTIESVTDFQVMNSIIAVVHMIGGAFIQVLLPTTSKVVASHDMKSYYRVAYDGTKYISILLCFCTFGMMCIGSEAITLYVGADYLYLLSWFNMWLICNLVTHNQAISSLILAGTDIRAISYNSAIASISGLMVSWFLIPYYQVGGVVIGFAIYGLIQMLFYYLYYWPKRMQINSVKVFFQSFLPYLAIGIVGYYLVLCLPFLDSSNIWISLILKGICFGIFFSVISSMTLNNRDRKFLVGIVKKK